MTGKGVRKNSPEPSIPYWTLRGVLKVSLSELLVSVVFDTSVDCSAQVSADVYHKGPDSKYFRFVGHMVFVASTQVCHPSMKAATQMSRFQLT